MLDSLLGQLSQRFGERLSLGLEVAARRAQRFVVGLILVRLSMFFWAVGGVVLLIAMFLYLTSADTPAFAALVTGLISLVGGMALTLWGVQLLRR